MNLPIASVIRKLRRDRNITQEELAAALGVTYQSVSRWENGQAYPDMELIPRIANYFGIQTDVLFGMDQVTIDSRRDAHYRKIEEVQQDKESFYNACLAAYEDFPDEFNFGRWLCRCYINFNIRPFEEHMDEVRTICQNIIRNCPDEDQRLEAFQMIVVVEDDDKLEHWLDMLPSWKCSREIMLERRYGARHEVDKCNLQRQKNFLSYMRYVFYNCIGKLDKNRYRNPEASVTGHRMVLDLIDILRDPSTDIDAWIDSRAFITMRLSAGCFGAGYKEEGYAALEKAVDLYVKYAELPIDTELSYNCPALDLMTANKRAEPEDDIQDDGIYECWCAYNALTNPEGWEWFNCVRDEERYKAQIDRLIPYLPNED